MILPSVMEECMKTKIAGMQYVKRSLKDQFKDQLAKKYNETYADRLEDNTNLSEAKIYVKELKEFFEPLGYDLSFVEQELLDVGYREKRFWCPMNVVIEVGVKLKQRYPELFNEHMEASLSAEFDLEADFDQDKLIEFVKKEK